jgi:hypothetical protein
MNCLRVEIIANPAELSWGIAEVSRVEVVDDEQAVQYSTSDTSFHHLKVWRESGSWIDAVFSEMGVTETSGPPRSADSWV